MQQTSPRTWRFLITLSAVVTTALVAGAALATSPDERTDAALRGLFRPRRVEAVPARTVSIKSIESIANKLAQLRTEAPPLNPPLRIDPDLSSLAKRIAEGGDKQKALADVIRSYGFSVDCEKLLQPPKTLTYRECYVAARLNERLFQLAHDDQQKLTFGRRATDAWRQYIRLSAARDKAWQKLVKEGIPTDSGRSAEHLTTRDLESTTFSEFCDDVFCFHIWYSGGHQYASVLVDQKGKIELATLDRAARILSEQNIEYRTTQQVESFLRDVLRALPYDSRLIASAADIPREHPSKQSKQQAERDEAKWQTFLNGPGRSITPIWHVKIGSRDQYVLYVHQILGGVVVRYTLVFDGGKFVGLKEEDIARWVGRYWAIM